MREYAKSSKEDNAQAMYESGMIPVPSVEEAEKYCKECKMGTHKCNVKTRHGFCCDICLEEELLYLRYVGVHPVASCCGHGDPQKASILVVGQEPETSEKMHSLGYEKSCIECTGERQSNWKPKSVLMYEEEKHNG